MGRRANLPDHRAKVHDFRERVSKAEADAMWWKYGFRLVGFNLHGHLNYVLSSRDIFLELEERPDKESIKILRAIHTAATSLRAYLDKPGANKLLCIHHEEPVADPFMRVHHPTGDTDVLVALEARCVAWPAPAKRLRQDTRKTSERLRDALEKAGYKEIAGHTKIRGPTDSKKALFSSGSFLSEEDRRLLRGKDLRHGLDWLIQASAAAVKEIEDHRTRLHRPAGWTPPKPRRTVHRWLIRKLWDLFLSADPAEADTIQWDRANKQYVGTFYEFAKEVFLKAGIRLSGGRLGNLVKGVAADK